MSEPKKMKEDKDETVDSVDLVIDTSVIGTEKRKDNTKLRNEYERVLMELISSGEITFHESPIGVDHFGDKTIIWRKKNLSHIFQEAVLNINIANKDKGVRLWYLPPVDREFVTFYLSDVSSLFL